MDYNTRPHEILGYWVDYKLKKAYCIIKYTDVYESDDRSNIFFVESEYNGN